MPGPDNPPIFNGAGQGNCKLTQDVTVSSLVFDQVGITLNLNGNNLKTNGASLGAGSIVAANTTDTLEIIAGTVDWTGTDILGSVKGTLLVDSGAVLYINCANGSNLRLGFTLSNAGTVILAGGPISGQGGNLVLYNDPGIINTGTFDDQQTGGGAIQFGSSRSRVGNFRLLTRVSSRFFRGIRPSLGSENLSRCTDG